MTVRRVAMGLTGVLAAVLLVGCTEESVVRVDNDTPVAIRATISGNGIRATRQPSPSFRSSVAVTSGTYTVTVVTEDAWRAWILGQRDSLDAHLTAYLIDAALPGGIGSVADAVRRLNNLVDDTSTVAGAKTCSVVVKGDMDAVAWVAVSFASQSEDLSLLCHNGSP